MALPKLVSCLILAELKTETSLCKKDTSTYRLSIPSIHGRGLLLTQGCPWGYSFKIPTDTLAQSLNTGQDMIRLYDNVIIHTEFAKAIEIEPRGTFENIYNMVKRSYQTLELSLIYNHKYFW